MRISDWSSDVCSSDLWKGWWGTPAAFRSPGAETEPRIALIARLSAAHAESLPTDPAEPPLLAGGTLERFSGTPIRPVVAGQHFGTAEVVATDADATSFILALDRNATPESYQAQRSEEHTSELQSLMRISYAVFCLKKKNTVNNT